MIAVRCIRILDSSRPAATRAAAIDLLSSADGFVTVPAHADAIQDTYWRHALDMDQHIHGLSVLSLSGDRNQPRALSRLRDLLRHENSRVRGMAVTGLRLMLRNGSDLAVPTLLESLSDSDQQVRTLAMGALASPFNQQTGNTEVFDRLLALLTDPDARVRSATTEHLPHFGDQRERAMAIFATMIRSDDAALRVGVLNGLAGMKDRPDWAVEAALDAVTDESPDVQEAGAWLLQYTAAEQLRPHVDRLNALLGSSNTEVARVAAMKVDEVNRAKEADP